MIRRMADGDLDTVVDLWFEASIRAHHFISRGFWEKNRTVMRDTYLPNSESWVIEERGETAGFYSLVDDTLAAIFVRPDRQGRGLGGRLLDHAKSRRGRLELAVYVENEPSLAFYRKRGFAVVGGRLEENSGHSEYLMEWRA